MKHARFLRVVRTLRSPVRAAALICALGCVAVMPATASAVGTTAATGVYLKADSAKLIVSAPTRIDFGVSGDGSFICPAATSVQLKNSSVFAVKLANIRIEAKGGFTLTDQEAYAATSTNDALYYTLTLGSGAARQAAACTSELSITTPDANMTKVGTAGAQIDVATAGAIKNVTKDLAQAQQHSEITWTFEAGANT